MRGRRPSSGSLPLVARNLDPAHFEDLGSTWRTTVCAVPWPASIGGAQGGVDEWNCATAPHVSNWWPQAGRQPIEQPSGDVHLILEAAVVIDLDGLIENRLDALAQPCAGIVVLGPDRQDDRHEFGRLQVGCLALAEGGEDVVVRHKGSPGDGAGRA